MSRGRWVLVLLAVCLVVTVAAVVYAAGQAKAAAPKVVRAQQFELVDGTGKVRAVLMLVADGSPGLALHDVKGKLRASLGLLADGSPVLGFSDEKGKLRAGLALLPDGSPNLSLFDEKGQPIAGLP